MITEPSNEKQHYRQTLEDAVKDYELGLLTARGAIAAWVRIKLAPSWKQSIKPKEIRELFRRNGKPMARSTFWDALHALQESGLIDFAEVEQIEIVRMPSKTDIKPVDPIAPEPADAIDYRQYTEQVTSDPLGLWIEAIESRNKVMLEDLKRRGVTLPWRVATGKSNSPKMFESSLLAVVLAHLRTTSMGENANLAAAARWVAKREQSGEGLREINTFWESLSLSANQSTPRPAPQIPVRPSLSPQAAATTLFNAINRTRSEALKAQLTAQFREQVALLDSIPEAWKEVVNAA